MTHGISLLTILKTMGIFLKKSLLFSLITGTVLYILMRLLFLGSEFDQREAIELYLKTIFVTWSYINAWRIICVGIIWLEKKTATVKRAPVVNMPFLRKTAIVILAAGFAGAVNAAGPAPAPVKKYCNTWAINKPVDTDTDIDPKFYFMMRH